MQKIDDVIAVWKSLALGSEQVVEGPQLDLFREALPVLERVGVVGPARSRADSGEVREISTDWLSANPETLERLEAELRERLTTMEGEMAHV